jgi:uncharacterized protein (DUF488 family)
MVLQVISPWIKSRDISVTEMSEQRPIIFTIGHSTRIIADFVAILYAFKIKKIADVRTIPKSRRNPQFNQDALEQTLQAAGIEYLHLKDLGGLRQARKDSPNMAWKNASFRGFADYMQSKEFEESLKQLMLEAKQQATAVMCAEAVPWRCHRSLIADALLVRKFRVRHIMGLDAGREHVLTAWARVKDGKVIYPEEGSKP